MLVCEKHKFVCCFPPHTASYSLAHALRKHYPTKDYAPHHRLAKNYSEKYKSFLGITSARNPFTRLLSHFRHVLDIKQIPRDKRKLYAKSEELGIRRMRKTADAHILGFGQYLLKYRHDTTWMPMPVTTVFKEVMPFDGVVRQEHWEKDLKSLPLPGIEDIATDYSYHKKPSLSSFGAKWQDFYEPFPELIDWVRTFYKADFELFGYSDEL